MLRSAHRASRAGDWTGCAAVRAHLPRTQQPHRLAAVRLLFKRELAGWLVGGAGGNRTRVLRRRTRASPGAVSAVVFSAPALALTRRRQAQPQKSPAESS